MTLIFQGNFPCNKDKISERMSDLMKIVIVMTSYKMDWHVLIINANHFRFSLLPSLFFVLPADDNDAPNAIGHHSFNLGSCPWIRIDIICIHPWELTFVNQLSPVRYLIIELAWMDIEWICSSHSFHETSSILWPLPFFSISSSIIIPPCNNHCQNDN